MSCFIWQLAYTYTQNNTGQITCSTPFLGLPLVPLVLYFLLMEKHTTYMLLHEHELLIFCYIPTFLKYFLIIMHIRALSILNQTSFLIIAKYGGKFL